MQKDMPSVGVEDPLKSIKAKLPTDYMQIKKRMEHIEKLLEVLNEHIQELTNDYALLQGEIDRQDDESISLYGDKDDVI